ncbi:MAG TPA: CsgG/HfaB family protein [Tepidisphaeraceae bacterium]|nr:CsgG/HfaB family protein [Tepidisphaeraceae bacterium]
MNRIWLFIVLAMGVATALAVIAEADQPQTKPTSANPPGLTVAILDFETDTPGAPDLGSQISETLSATLSGEPGFTLVDRAEISKVLSEHSMNLSGLMNPNDAIKVGKLVGAKILVTGRAFALDKQVFITAKLISTETSLVQGVLVRGDKDADLASLVLSLSDKVAAKLRETGPQLVAADDTMTDPLPALKERLSKLKLPKVTVQVTERHIAALLAVRIDPAVDTELQQMLTQCGFTVIDGDETQQVEAGVSVVISGEGFSEYAARIGNLVSCIGRVEIKVTDRKTGEVLFSDRQTARAVDLAENTAGKTALQKAAHALGIRILSHFADTLPPNEAATQPGKSGAE